ncbi:hypothetical protein Q0M94_11035 [Deinococcus radiomollis]|uniref:hypothetical protein n=1 Tax=Deinococcus radiomollis TaxID=468916 RepID=UPI00389235F0
MHQDISSLDAKVASELAFILENIAEETDLMVKPSTELCNVLELYIPEQLAYSYPEWKSESLDGFFIASAMKTEPRTVKLTGSCILISDQTVTPFSMRLSLTLPRDSIASYQVYLGEPGGGRLGISGPLYGSSLAGKFMENVVPRLEHIEWSYMISSGVDFNF